MLSQSCQTSPKSKNTKNSDVNSSFSFTNLVTVVQYKTSLEPVYTFILLWCFLKSILEISDKEIWMSTSICQFGFISRVCFLKVCVAFHSHVASYIISDGTQALHFFVSCVFLACGCDFVWVIRISALALPIHFKFPCQVPNPKLQWQLPS